MFLQRRERAVSRMLAAVVIVVILVVAAVAAVLLIHQPSTTSSTTSSSTTVNTLTIDDSLYPTPTSMNPLLSFYDEPYPNWADYDVYQPLVGTNLSAESNQGVIQYEPILATSWTVSANNETYTFNLRPDVKFSNGDVFNAYEVWAEYYGYFALSGNSSAWLFGYNFFNYTNVNFGNSTIATIMQGSGLNDPSAAAIAIMSNSSWPIYAPSSSQIVFQLDTPFDWFLATLISAIGPLYDMQYVFQHGGLGSAVNVNTYFNNNPPPGTGPYTITAVSNEAYVTFTQNPTYWGANLTASQIAANPAIDPGQAKNVIINYKDDDVTRYTDLSTGAAQIVAIESTDWSEVTSNSEYGYVTLPSESGLLAGIALNTQSYPTNITDVRLAIVHAINYTAIDDEAFFGKVSPVIGPEYPAWSQFYNLANEPQYSYNIAMAESLLKSANLTGSISVTFPVLSGCTFCDTIAQVVEGDLAQIGITVNIQVEPDSVLDPQEFEPYAYENATAMGNLAELGIPDFAPGTLSPADNWISLVSDLSVGGNFAAYSNPTVNACAAAFTTTSNITQIQDLCKAAQEQLYNDAPIAWIGGLSLYGGAGSLVWQKSVISGFYTDPLWSGVDTAPLFNTVSFTK